MSRRAQSSRLCPGNGSRARRRRRGRARCRTAARTGLDELVDDQPLEGCGVVVELVVPVAARSCRHSPCGSAWTCQQAGRRACRARAMSNPAAMIRSSLSPLTPTALARSANAVFEGNLDGTKALGLAAQGSSSPHVLNKCEIASRGPLGCHCSPDSGLTAVCSGPLRDYSRPEGCLRRRPRMCTDCGSGLGAWPATRHQRLVVGR